MPLIYRSGSGSGSRIITDRGFSVQDDVVIFAPGAMHSILLLWVGDPKDSVDLGDCEGMFPLKKNFVSEFDR